MSVSGLLSAGPRSWVFAFRGPLKDGAPCRCGVGWGGWASSLGVGFAGHRFSVPGEYKKTIMSDKDNHGPQYPAQAGAKITGDRQRDFETQGVTSGLATCGPEHGVPAQGILGSKATCATLETTESQEWQSVPPRQLAAIGDLLLCRQRRNSAKKQHETRNEVNRQQ